MRFLPFCAAVGCMFPEDDNGGHDTDTDTGTEPGGGTPIGYRWHDANGEPVTVGEDLVIFDEDGFVWGIGLDTTEFFPLLDLHGSDLNYFGAGCTGDAWIQGVTSSAFTPRYVALFDVDVPNLGHIDFVVRPDDLPGGPVDFDSFLENGVCTNIAGGFPVTFAFRVADLFQATMPVAWWTPPLHPELIE